MITQKKIILWGLVIAIVGFFFGYIAAQKQADLSSRACLPASGGTRGSIIPLPSASIMLDYGDGMVRTYNDIKISTDKSDQTDKTDQSDTTILDITRDIAVMEKLEFKTKDYGELGLLVEQIGKKKNGDEGKYWQYWVNNVASQVAASALTVKAGDVIEWKFLNYK